MTQGTHKASPKLLEAVLSSQFSVLSSQLKKDDRRSTSAFATERLSRVLRWRRFQREESSDLVKH